MKIYSPFYHLVNPSTQQEIINGAINYGGVSAVTLVWTNENTDFAPTYDVYDESAPEDEGYLFSIDSDGDVIYDR